MTTPEELDALQAELRIIGCHSNGDARCTCSIGADADAAITALRARVAELEAENRKLQRVPDRILGHFLAALPLDMVLKAGSSVGDLIEAIKGLATRAERAEAERDGFRRNLRESFEAMCAMRDSINEHLPMPSLESDLLQGPETSVFCATVAEAVVSELARRGQGVPLTANALADAFEAMWNAALGVAIERQEGHAVASMLAEGFAAMSRHLRESAALVPPGDGWRSMDSAPKDGRMLTLLVDYSTGSAPLDDAMVAATIGFNSFTDTGEDVWQFAGWNWCQDQFCEGDGVVIGWAEFSPPAPPASEPSEYEKKVAQMKEDFPNGI